jgi:lipoprotein NlpI
LRKARTAYEDASRVGAYRAAALLRLGEIDAREGNQKGAERHLEDARQIEPDDVRVIEELTAIKMAEGNVGGGKTLAQQELKISPASASLKESLSEPDLKQLGNDTNRVLNLAAQYMRLGLYQRALDVLSRSYPPPEADQTEPGALPPDKHPMVAYFRGYCREQLQQAPLADYAAASKLSTAYVFPSTAQELSALQAAVRANTNDATAHYLLGTLYFSRGITDSALTEWSMSRKLNPKIPVMDASLGLALLHEKRDPENALSAFRDGLSSDSANETNYLGADQALSLLGRPASDRVQILEKYPDLANAPSELIFELILNLAEQGDFQRAESLFHNRFFPREEGGTNVRQIWIEVQLEKISSLAKQKQCAEALSAAEHLSTEVPDLIFTRDGLGRFANSARAQFVVGSALTSCAKPQQAAEKFQSAAKASGPDEVFWAWQGAKKLPGFDGRQWEDRLRSALAESDRRTGTSSFAGWWYYTAGALEAALGNSKQADTKFQKALLLPDRVLSYHSTRLAKAELFH